MIIFGSCVPENSERYRAVALPTIERAKTSDDLVLTGLGDRGIAAVYNEFIDVARSRPDCDALVLLHDDVEIVDRNFRAKALAAVRESEVGVVGVVGGHGLRSIEWWRARRVAGRVFESRGLIEFGSVRADVDVVDGLTMVLSREAFTKLTFDEVGFPRFHGYDVDFCLQALSAGLRVTVRPLELLHRTKGGYGDQADFDAASVAAGLKWPDRIHSPSIGWRVAERARRTQKIARRGWISALHRAGRIRRFFDSVDFSSVSQPSAACPASTSLGFGETDERLCPACLVAPLVPSGLESEVRILTCDGCGTGRTWPPPGRDIEGDGLWQEMYGAARLSRREMWLSEALKRVEWMQLYASDGCLLEVGCGTGEFLKVAQDQGYECYGVEPSGWAAEQARALGVQVETGMIGDWVRRYSGLRPSTVALWHVLEHIPEPHQVLGDIFAILEPAGFLLIEVPNYASSEALRLGLGWEGAQPNDHFFHYTPEGLAKLLARAGFEVIQILPLPRRLYSTASGWAKERNHALLDRRDWPPFDLLRAVARRPIASSGQPEAPSH